MVTPLTSRHLLDLLAVVREADVELLEIETGDFTLTLRRNDAARDVTVRAGSSAHAKAGNTQPEPAAVAAPEPEVPPGPHVSVDVPDGCVVISAPMVGVFYRRPEPGADPSVDVGTTVTAGSTVALIEVMKLFNAVTSSVDGVVESVLAADGALVEYGEPLVAVRVAEPGSERGATP